MALTPVASPFRLYVIAVVGQGSPSSPSWEIRCQMLPMKGDHAMGEFSWVTSDKAAAAQFQTGSMFTVMLVGV